MRYFIIFVIITLFLFSCNLKEIESKLPDREIDFVIVEKIILKNSKGGDIYFFKSKNTIIECNPSDYLYYNINDTLNLVIHSDGFFKGVVFKNRKSKSVFNLVKKEGKAVPRDSF
ncbi:Lipoprotein [Candidatus Ornithobacterium hominis]|nr:Lipoprotein [Candidatus Ornithobacterium hominis]